MIRMTKRLLPVAFLLAPTIASAAWTVGDNHKKLDHACAKDEVVDVQGNNNQVILHGECARVTVVGNANDVLVEAAGAIDVQGNKNHVAWARGLGGKDPAVSDAGSGNKVEHADKK